MPQRSGLDILQEIRCTYDANELPIIMMTAQDGTNDIVTALDAGANDYITKPVNIEVALSRINTQISHHQLRKDSEKKKQVEAINAMIATYNHEVNNPLAIALGNLAQYKKTHGSESVQLERLEKALLRIKGIVKAIEKMSSSESIVEFENYTDDAKMLKIK